MIKALKQILVRSLGVIMFAFIPGMAVGGPTVGWFMGGVIGVATIFSSIIIFFGVQLAWDAMISHEDIEKGFRAAVAKQAAENEHVRNAVEVQTKDYEGFEDLEFDDSDPELR